MSAEDDRPAVILAVESGISQDYVRWVSFGAEEEGVPCRVETALSGAGALELGYSAAGRSAFGIGVGIGRSEIVLHEAHMPEGTPVMRHSLEQDGAWPVCRMFGHNAARMVTQNPLRFEPLSAAASAREAAATGAARTVAVSEEQVAGAAEETLDEEVKRAVSVVIRRLRERGVL